MVWSLLNMYFCNLIDGQKFDCEESFQEGEDVLFAAFPNITRGERAVEENAILKSSRHVTLRPLYHCTMRILNLAPVVSLLQYFAVWTLNPSVGEGG